MCGGVNNNYSRVDRVLMFLVGLMRLRNRDVAPWDMGYKEASAES